MHLTWDKNGIFYGDRRIGPTDLLIHNNTIAYIKGVPLREIYEYIKPNQELWSLILNMDLDYTIAEYDDIKDIRDLHLEDQFIDRISIYTCIELDEKENSMLIRTDASGHKDGCDECRGFSCSPLENFINAQVYTEDKIIMTSYGNETPFKRQEYTNDSGHHIAEIFYTIFDEITWLGTPEQREDFMEETQQTIQDIKTGKCKTISFEELRERMHESDIHGDSGQDTEI